ncbi:MAG: cardiolipin synthase [Ruminococcus sp.]|jgi:cardiolipin synthase|nr:cardiolipin synthase [Ruminococcus sp.]
MLSKTVLKIIFSRKIVIFLLVLVQLAAIFIGLSIFSTWRAFYVCAVVLSVLGVVAVVNSDKNPAYKTAWILPIMAFPVFGIAAYLYVVFNPGILLLRKLTARSEKITRAVIQRDETVYENLPGEFSGLANYAYDCGNCPAWECEDIKYYPEGADFFEDFLDDLRSAKKYILLEFFIINEGRMWNKTLEVLREKQAEGVDIKIMYDGIGTQLILPTRYDSRLKKMGFEVRIFNPLKPFLSTIQNNRDHRKIVVIDGIAAYTGGVNIADEYIGEKIRFGEWKDVAVRFSGRAVKNFTAAFFQLWHIGDNTNWSENFNMFLPERKTPEKAPEGYIIPYSDTPVDYEHVAELVYIDIINRAEHYLYISTPYLVLSPELELALEFAAKRGVDIKLLIPGIPDKKYMLTLAQSFFEGLLKNGVKIFEFSPGFNHAKIFVSDDKFAAVGSVNLDYRSLYLHYECGLLIYSNPVIKNIKRDMVKTLARSREITQDTVAAYPVYRKISAAVLKMFAPLL